MLLLCPHDYSFGLLQYSPHGTIFDNHFEIILLVQNTATYLLVDAGCCKDIILYFCCQCRIVCQQVFGCSSKFWCHKEASFVWDIFPSNYDIHTLYPKQIHIQLISFLNSSLTLFKALHISSNTFVLLLPRLPLEAPLRNKGNNSQFFLLFSILQGIQVFTVKQTSMNVAVIHDSAGVSVWNWSNWYGKIPELPSVFSYHKSFCIHR